MLKYCFRKNMLSFVKTLITGYVPNITGQDSTYSKNISFMESVAEALPQTILSALVLRSYGLSTDGRTRFSQIFSIICSFLSMIFAFGLVSNKATVNQMYL